MNATTRELVRYRPQEAHETLADARDLLAKGSTRSASNRVYYLIEGQLPPRVIGLVLEWAFEHRDELLADWELAQTKKPLRDISPLV